MSKYPNLKLPISIAEDTIEVDEDYLKITEVNSFLTKQLGDFYLSISSVYPKIVYKTFWLEETFKGPLTKAGLKLKVTTVYPDVVGIEYAKTKTIKSENYPRLLEILSGNGYLILENDDLETEVKSFIIPLETMDKTVIPPNWHYALVNTSEEQFVTVEYYHEAQELNNCQGDKRGSGLYIVERNGSAEVVKNSRYKKLRKYATVYPEHYAKSIKIAPKGTFIEDLDHTVAHILDIDHSHWHIHITRDEPEVFSF